MCKKLHTNKLIKDFRIEVLKKKIISWVKYHLACLNLRPAKLKKLLFCTEIMFWSQKMLHQLKDKL